MPGPLFGVLWYMVFSSFLRMCNLLCGLSACCRWQNNSVSPSDSLRAASEKHRGSSDYSLDSKKRKMDEKYVSVFYWFLCFVVFTPVSSSPVVVADGILSLFLINIELTLLGHS